MNALTPIVASFTSSGHAGTVIDTRVYDNGGRMTSSTYNNAGAAIGNLTYGWDSNHNKTSEAISGTMSNYGFTIPAGGYDAEDRLVSFTRTAGLTQAWNLSPVGDWNSVTTNGTAQTRTHGPTHELLTGAGQNVSTDVKGNITLIPAALRPTATSLLLNWDFDNRLSTADLGNNGSIDVTYRFDALGRRVYRQSSSGTTVYVQSGQQTIADYVAGTAPASPIYRYVYASYIDEPVMRFKPVGSERMYYHRNQQYSIVALTGNTGAIQERYAYSAYGTPTITDSAGALRAASAVDNRITYTGREWDAGLVLYHYRARLYDPTLGRFCSRDPIGFEGGIGLYVFTKCLPLHMLDPDGTDPFTLISCFAWCSEQASNYPEDQQGNFLLACWSVCIYREFCPPQEPKVTRMKKGIPKPRKRPRTTPPGNQPPGNQPPDNQPPDNQPPTDQPKCLTTCKKLGLAERLCNSLCENFIANKENCDALYDRCLRLRSNINTPLCQQLHLVLCPGK